MSPRRLQKMFPPGECKTEMALSQSSGFDLTDAATRANSCFVKFDCMKPRHTLSDESGNESGVSIPLAGIAFGYMTDVSVTWHSVQNVQNKPAIGFQKKLTRAFTSHPTA